MGNISQKVIKGKISMIFLSRIAELNDKKKLHQKVGESKPIGLTFNFTELALGIEMRNATISAIMRCQSLPLFPTILKCLDSIQMTLTTFGTLFENISDEEALKHFQKMEKLYPLSEKSR